MKKIILITLTIIFLVSCVNQNVTEVKCKVYFNDNLIDTLIIKRPHLIKHELHDDNCEVIANDVKYFKIL